jgi:hypothetical protein
MKIIEELRCVLNDAYAGKLYSGHPKFIENSNALIKATAALIEIAGVEKLEPKIASYEIGHNAALDRIQEIIERNMG